MPERVERRLGRGVPQSGLHHLDVGARRDQQRREVVPQIVVPEPGRQAVDLLVGRLERENLVYTVSGRGTFVTPQNMRDSK